MINNIKKGFTLAEVLIVLTILGIIAAISMTTLKPAEFKAKGMAIAAKKVLYDVDVATTELLLDYASAGSEAVIPAGTCTPATLTTEYKKKLSAIRKTGFCAGGYNSNTTSNFFLKSGACLAFGAPINKSTATIFPGEGAAQNVSSSTCGIIYFDVNGVEGPNVLGSDIFIIPLDVGGIQYAS